MPHNPTDKTVLIQEVGPRDGLQNEAVILSPEVRADLIERLVDAGLPRIQIGSFVNPRRVPQMAETDKVWKRLRKKEDVRYSVLVLNQRGVEQAIARRVPHVEVYVSASETHSLKNSGRGMADALERAGRMIGSAVQNGIGVTAGVMCAFGCFYEGAVPVERVVKIVSALDACSTAEIGLADTTGMALPDDIKRVIGAVGTPVRVDRLALHLHDTRGLGMANLLAALEMGVRRFDTSVGGLGGCPFIPGAVGNISTEQTAEILASRGFHTGVDVEKVRRVKEMMDRLVVGSSLTA
ncbi:MAG: hydroxymethylglutaryl-CoA lyase [Desulfomonilaceae bacterium]